MNLLTRAAMNRRSPHNAFVEIEVLKDIGSEIEALAEILHACVHGGASVNFVLPFSLDDAKAFWRRVSGSIVFVARIEGKVVGTVQLVPAKQPNQPHRADVAKLLVHPKARRQGVARALMTALEERALADGRTLLCLDTNTGDAAEPLYQSMGYTLLGVVPGYSVPVRGGEPMSASFYYKGLGVRG
jgi:hypothetical protein